MNTENTTMTQAQQPEALRLARKFEEVGFMGDHRFAKDHWCRQAAAELRSQHARIAELEAQLSAIGAGVCQRLKGEEFEERLYTEQQVRSLLAATPAAQGMDAEIQQAVESERERICAAIKAEDDHCIDQGDYMLDSNDCIKIVRGKWVRPDYSLDAAQAKQGGV